MKTVMVISDATGETAERMVRAAVLQFSDVPVNVRVYSRVRLESEVEAIIERAAELEVINSVQSGLAAELDLQGIIDLVGDKIQDVFDDGY